MSQPGRLLTQQTIDECGHNAARDAKWEAHDRPDECNYCLKRQIRNHESAPFESFLRDDCPELK
jgi:hypothetical protein